MNLFSLYNSMKMSKLNKCYFFRHNHPALCPLPRDSMLGSLYDNVIPSFALSAMAWGCQQAAGGICPDVYVEPQGNQVSAQAVRDDLLQPFGDETDGWETCSLHLLLYSEAVGYSWEAETGTTSFPLSAV